MLVVKISLAMTYDHVATMQIVPIIVADSLLLPQGFQPTFASRTTWEHIFPTRRRLFAVVAFVHDAAIRIDEKGGGRFAPAVTLKLKSCGYLEIQDHLHPRHRMKAMVTTRGHIETPIDFRNSRGKTWDQTCQTEF